jgi:plastocyanin
MIRERQRYGGNEMHRVPVITLAMRAAIFALVLPSIGCGYGSPTAPDTSGTQPGPVGASITIMSSGITPANVTVMAGQSVTFTNNDSVAHEIVSTPVPTYADCPSINRVSRLEPGQSMQTGAFTTSRSCGFLDLLRRDDSKWQGTIVVQ